MARELDVEAARFIRDELKKREDEREKRDRVFWIGQFGGEVPEDLISETEPQMNVTIRTEEEALARSPLGGR